MGRPLRVLLVESSEDDALLLLRQLRRGGYKPVYERVDTPEGMKRALKEADERGELWEIVLSDYYMPRFQGPDALALLKRLGYEDIPFIVVSGKVGEETAVEMMRAGAHDYITKENMSRLTPAIERELREAEVRWERGRIKEELTESEERFRLLVKGVKDYESFNAASIGKLPALIALYRDAAHGEVDLEDEIVILPEDVQSYGTGVLHTWPVGSALSLRECAYYLINESDNTAWAMLTRHLGQESIQDELAEPGAKSTNYWAPNTTTPNDVLLMLEKIADPSFTSPTLSEEMLSFMVDTNHEDRIPAALPSEVRVAHKAGSYEDTYGDAGIIFLEGGGSSEEESYFVVVLAKGTGEYEAREVIHEVSFAAHRLLAGEV